ncbi:MAG: nucleoside hydrolase [Bdellovibrionales bacterium]
MELIICDGDWGSDDAQVFLVLAAQPERFKILGITATFGNTTQKQVFYNAGSIQGFFGVSDIKRYPGAAGPSNEPSPEGDDAYGSSGVGGVVLPPPENEPQTQMAEDFILETLKAHPSGSVTITATGPLTNIAVAFRKDPEAMRRVKQIVIMGACTKPLPAKDMPVRQGNLTPYAEFNFHMAPNDAATVMTSGLPLVVLPMNCTQQLDFTPVRESILRRELAGMPELETVVSLMKVPAEIDMRKFGASAFMHDVHTAVYLAQPDLYEGQRGDIAVDLTDGNKGHSVFTPRADSNILVMEKQRDPDAVFDIVCGSFKKLLQEKHHGKN